MKLRLYKSKKTILGCDARGDGDSAYLTRYVLLETRRGNLNLHQFHRSDASDMHNHPWAFWSLILWPGYQEVTPEGTKRRWPLALAYRPAEWRRPASFRLLLDLPRQRRRQVLPSAVSVLPGKRTPGAPVLDPRLDRPEVPPLGVLHAERLPGLDGLLSRKPMLTENAAVFTGGQRVEVWLAGWDQWLRGEVESAGFLHGVQCVRVLLDEAEEVSVWRVDQVRAMKGLFAL